MPVSYYGYLPFKGQLSWDSSSWKRCEEGYDRRVKNHYWLEKGLIVFCNQELGHNS